MSRYHQRRAQSLQNPEVIAGYQEMDSELRVIEALDHVRQLEGVSIVELARRMDRHAAAISRLFNAERPNPTLETFHAALKALQVTAEIHLRPARGGEPPITVDVDMSERVPA